MESYRDVSRAAAKRQPEMLKMIGELVGLESPTEDRAGVNRCVALVERWMKASGGKSQRSKQKTAGDLLVGRFGPARSGVKPLMLLGHLDTVWPLGTLKKMPFRVRQGRAWGPGVLDMKAGVVMALTALRMLREAGQLTRPVWFLLNSDEETGSECSRALTESLARKCAAVFVLEPAQGIPGAYKTARKGVGQLSPASARGGCAQRGGFRPGTQRGAGTGPSDRARQRLYRPAPGDHGQCRGDRRGDAVQCGARPRPGRSSMCALPGRWMRSASSGASGLCAP